MLSTSAQTNLELTQLSSAFQNNPQQPYSSCYALNYNEIYHEQQQQPLFNYNNGSTNDLEDDSDISNEVNAEMKINKIDKKLQKSYQINKVDKRRLQNRRSALKCRLRKAHTITTLSQEVANLKNEHSYLISEVQLRIFFNPILLLDNDAAKNCPR